MKEISRRSLLRPTRDPAGGEAERDRQEEETGNKIGRRELLKGGAGGALALGVLGLAAAPAFADHDDDGGLFVHVHGNLRGKAPTPSTVRLAVSFEVFGKASSLAGAGWDGGTGTGPAGLVPGGPPPAGPIGACYYTASGSLRGRTLTLVGRSLVTNIGSPRDTEEPARSDTRADGRDFNATVNVRTGRVTHWSLSPLGASFESDPANPSLVMVARGGSTRP
jgi:hypothetical protein